MLIKQESVLKGMGLKDLPKASPLPNANLVLVFGSVAKLSDPKLSDFLESRFPIAQIIGCTTTGEISASAVHDESLQITAILLERSSLRTSSIRMEREDDSYRYGEQLARQLKSEELKAVIVLSEGLNVNGSELLNGFRSIIGETPVLGGMAGDNATFTKTLQMCNGVISDNLIVAVGLYGENIHISSGALGGWKPYGPPRKVTRSIKNIVYEMDGQPALPLYKMYIGEHFAKGLPGTGLKFPFAVIGQEKEVETVRTLLSIDAATNSLTFAGDVSEGNLVRFCQTTHDRLVDGASGAATEVKKTLNDQFGLQQSLAVCVSCVGRKLVMADQVYEEVRAVRNVLGPQTVLTGFYANGEFGPNKNKNGNDLHNQTMTIGYISEYL
jgi:hypothetical protein